MATNAIETSGLSRSFSHGTVYAVRNVSLAVPTGSVFGIVGKNGAGKSTLLKLIAGFMRQDAGTVSVLGRQLRPGESDSRIGALVDDLFTYARAADPSWEPELVACDLAAAVTDALAARYEAFAARGWEPDVRLGETAPVLAAPDALARVIANLLENALAHGSGAPRVRVEGTALTVENPVAPGDAARLDPARLTERFYQGDPSRTGRGTGLGLAVARALTESMGGSLAVSVTSGDHPLFSARAELRPAP